MPLSFSQSTPFCDVIHLTLRNKPRDKNFNISHALVSGDTMIQFSRLHSGVLVIPKHLNKLSYISTTIWLLSDLCQITQHFKTELNEMCATQTGELYIKYIQLIHVSHWSKMPTNTSKLFCFFLLLFFYCIKNTSCCCCYCCCCCCTSALQLKLN